MQLFIGTLYSIENEYSECIQAIENQSYQHFEHVIIKNLPNKKAHDALFSSFIERTDQFDLLVKIDADMVLVDCDFFAKVVQRFTSDEKLEHLEIAVQDFFSDQPIWGMNIYRNTIYWQKNNEDLFVDNGPTYKSRKVRDDADLAPAAVHCKNPGRFQSFHYGIHKGIKIMQPGRTRKKRIYAEYHWQNVRRTWQHFLKSRDVRLGLASLGAETALKCRLTPEHVDYTDSRCKVLYSRYARSNADDILRAINRLRRWNWGFLSDQKRKDIICYLEGGTMLHPRSYIRILKEIGRRIKTRALK
jgi:hypothetical protein